MKNIVIACSLLLAFTSCKKSAQTVETSGTPTISKPGQVDMSDPFSALNFSDPKLSIDYSLENNSDIAYIGYLSTITEVKKKTVNPFIGAALTDISYRMDATDGSPIATSPEIALSLSEFRQSYSNLVYGGSTLVSKPRINYQIYASEDIKNTSSTAVTLVIKAVYFDLTIPAVSAQNIKLYTPSAEGSIKDVTYLSKISYGMMGRYELKSSTTPAKYLPYLKAYIDDLINNNGKNSAELMKVLDTQSVIRYNNGGKFDPNIVLPGETNQTIKDFVALFSLPQPTSELSNISYEFRTLKDNSIVN